MKDYLIIGKIGGAHGVRGEVRVTPFTDDVRRFHRLKDCLILDEKEQLKFKKTAVSARIDEQHTLLKFEDVSDRDEAAKLNGLFIAVTRDQAIKLPKDKFFIADLIGLTVVDAARGELGQVKDILNYGASDIIVVRRKGKNDLLIPYLKTIVFNVSLEDGTMDVILPDGLYEIYE